MEKILKIRILDLCSLPRFCLVHTVDFCANEEWFCCDQVII